jgi:hypothetical protein
MTAFARQMVCYTLHLSRETNSFFSQDLKRRFSSIGGTITLLLKSSVRRDLPVLQEVLKECNIGRDRCCAVCMCHQVEQKDRPLKGFESCLRTELLRSTMGGALTSRKGVIWPDFSRLVLDWELLHLCLTEWSFNGGKLVRVDLDAESEHVTLQLDRMNIPSPRLKRLASALGGYVRNDVFRFAAKWSDEGETLPKRSFYLRRLAKLTVAVIDDNELVRVNLLHALIAYMPRDQILVRGETDAECYGFPDELILHRVDLAVVSLKLDVTDETDATKHVSISGVDIAKAAKAKGFQGCMVILSSDVTLADVLKQGAPVHAVVKKTADTRTLLWRLLSARDLFELERGIRGLCRET